MLLLNFDTPALDQLAVLDFLNMPRVTLSSGGAMQGEGILQSQMLQAVLSIASTAWPMFKIVGEG